jgi:hypothetical protein
MKQKLISALETLGYPVMLQGSFNPEETYPDSYITFWCADTDDNAHFDNEVTAWDWFFSVIFYSNNPTLVNTIPNEIRAVLKSAGFISQGKGNDIPSDEPSHTGWAMEFICTEENN